MLSYSNENFIMTAAKPLDASLPFALKQEHDTNDIDGRDNNEDEDNASVSDMPLPPIPDSNLIAADDPNDEFLRLTTMVRGVYFTHLHKSLVSNYNICCEPKNEDFLQSELKKCTGQIELNAVRASLEASLYRQTMLKMISDIKAHTSQKKMHKKLALFLNQPPSKMDVAIQTNNELSSETTNCSVLPDSSAQVKDSHVQSSSITSNYDEFVSTRQPCKNPEVDNLDSRISAILNESSMLDENKSDINKTSSKVPQSSNAAIKNEQPKQIAETYNDIQQIFGNGNAISTKDTNDDSQDSLLQHLEDMFCESDDSSDLMTLIERHSGVSKEKVDMEIGKMCPEPAPLPPLAVNKPTRKDNAESSDALANNKRKLSFSNYKKMKKQATGQQSLTEEELIEEKKKQKASGIWFVERVHQVSKLKTKMTEISITNYRKHGRIMMKFIELFGESDDEDMMPESPICIEEHLIACKERIAPWVVKHLMPFYNRKRITGRQLFKLVAKHITDMLIIENTFPEEVDVNKHIHHYFRNKRNIKTKSDIYI